ncbi:MAG: DNA helicase RecQ, partial [Victivallales bacterium]|nr:DNA helicase RecQ [Victivallales bacterium]
EQLQVGYMVNRPEKILKNTFGYEEFRPLQREIIENILDGRDTLAILPTGGGKSLCYQIPSIILEGLTVVVSPLISLMKDQIEQLNEFGIKAVVLNSSISREEYSSNVNEVRTHKAKLLYVAPETLLQERTTALLKEVKVSLITVDEAHCISEWGHEFRPEYRRLLEIKNYLPEAVWAAFTATATPRVQADIEYSLGFGEKNVFIASFNRKNLFLDVVTKVTALEQTLNFVSSFPKQPGIIYCLSRKQVDLLSEQLSDEGFKAKPYHAGLSDGTRQKNQSLFINDDIDIIVATIAFGMGINKPDIRFVLHYDLPKNLESYYQQIGRAGRDGLHSYCRLLFSYRDLAKIRYFINKMNKPKEKRIAEIHLDAMIDFAESRSCRRIPLINYFGEEYNEENCGMCDNCTVKIDQQKDITIQSQKFMSCVARSRQSFGCGHIIDILRGSKAEKVLKLHHDELSTYNIGKEFSREEWMIASNELIKQNYINRDENGVLKLNKSAWKVFKNEVKVYSSEIRKSQKAEDGRKEADYDTVLYEKLRQLRKELSEEREVPPFVIFSNKTLMDICRKYPQSLNSFSGIYGIGRLKAEKYASFFLEVIKKYCSTNDIPENLKSSNIKPKRSPSKAEGNKTEIAVLALRRLRDIDRVAEHLNVKQETVIEHLYRYVRKGNSISNAEDLLKYIDLDEETVKAIFYYFEELGCSYLKPVYQEFEGEISYDDLRILRIVFMS